MVDATEANRAMDCKVPLPPSILPDFTFPSEVERNNAEPFCVV